MSRPRPLVISLAESCPLVTSRYLGNFLAKSRPWVITRPWFRPREASRPRVTSPTPGHVADPGSRPLQGLAPRLLPCYCRPPGQSWESCLGLLWVGGDLIGEGDSLLLRADDPSVDECETAEVTAEVGGGRLQ